MKYEVKWDDCGKTKPDGLFDNISDARERAKEWSKSPWGGVTWIEDENGNVIDRYIGGFSVWS